ncbi:hypothetical protein J8273_7156 [Carpediemonas membranifera]|uniref:Uncharacterized protein n=1 Tax=Carpediemonas membranifera TaxID=201153 RepID=A0A8J6BUZ6_9EUKA|nr:hypothetical protein J8273_7156 [Carpediemonas membranifera]|eukprot:KAG9390891.1 hypothetical protein J8273_7156 [Carpediemonas membranifera]
MVQGFNDPAWFYTQGQPVSSPSEFASILLGSKRMTFLTALGVSTAFRFVGWPTLMRSMGASFSWDRKDLTNVGWELSPFARLFFSSAVRRATNPKFGIALNLSPFPLLGSLHAPGVSRGLQAVSRTTKQTTFVPEGRFQYDRDGETCPAPILRSVRGIVREVQTAQGKSFTVDAEMRSWYHSKPWTWFSVSLLPDSWTLEGIAKQFSTFGPRQLRESRLAMSNWRRSRDAVDRHRRMSEELRVVATR